MRMSFKCLSLCGFVCRGGWCCALIVLAAACSVAGARNAPNQKTSGEAAYARAAELRDRLESEPAGQRTRAEYKAVLDAYRAIYHREPTAGKAPAAVEAVAELLAEEGRGLHDEHALLAARGQYEFLLKQYPKSPQVALALLNEGELCRNDLDDARCSRGKLHAVVRRFPDSSYAEQAELDLKPADAQPRKAAATPSPAAPGNSTEPLEPVQAHAAPEPAAAGAVARKTMVAVVTPAAAEESAPVKGPRGGALSGKTAEITGIRHWSNPVSTRIAIDLSGEVEYEAARVSHPDRIFFDLHGARLAHSLNGREVEVIDDGYLKRIRAAQYKPGVTRVVLDVTDVSDYSAFLLPNPWRLILDIHGGRPTHAESTAEATQTTPNPAAANTVAEVAALSDAPTRVTATRGPTSAPVAARVSSPESKAQKRHRNSGKPARQTDSLPQATIPATMAQAAQPTANGQRSLVRALGLKVNRIVIDAGHGGHDSGTLGPGGIEEKNVVLDVALRTGKLLEERLGAQVIYTRDDDTFVPLETRTAIANKAQADLFLSIHANSSPEPEARGVETYYLNFTSDPQALEVAARENAVSDAGVHQLSDLVRKIALKDKIDESREFAADVDESLYRGLGDGNIAFKDRGVKKAPFVVLIGAQMPSVLAEISFLTNPEDARLLRKAAWRERIAESLATGVERYLDGLSSTRPVMEASRSEQAQ